MPQANYQRKTTPGTKKTIERIREKLAREAESYARMLLPDGEKRGSNWVALSPFRPDKSLGSFLVSLSDSNGMPAGKFRDFSTDETGDLLDIWQRVRGGSFADIAEALGIAPTLVAVSTNVTATPADWSAIIPAPVPPERQNFAHNDLGFPTATWAYHTPSGEIAGYACRFERPDGSKETRILCYCRKDNLRFWMYRNWPGVKPRPLFNAQRLSANPDLPVLVVEGEKCAEAAQALLAEFVVVTWPLGANGVRAADWSLLAGRNVTVWPDNDAPGMSAAKAIIGIIAGKVMQVPEGKPEGWDVADAIKEGMTAEQLRALIGNVTREEAKTPEPPKEVSLDTAGFEVLGHAAKKFFFYQRASKQIFELRADQLVTHEIALAPLWWWKEHYSYEVVNDKGEAKKEYKTKVALSSVVEQAYKKGYIDVDDRRGRGLWKDAGRYVLNLGDCLRVGDKTYEYGELQTSRMYWPSEKIYRPSRKAASAQVGVQIFTALEKLNWRDKTTSARLLCGWIFLAPICGALTWRPALWLSSQAGAGKTWIQENVINALVSGWGRFYKGKSTEAGLRGEIKYDAIPVMFDEIESENNADRDRINAIMQLMRVSSSDDSAEVVKGTQGGGSTKYKARCMWLFGSIIPGTTLHQDKTRVTYLDLLPDESETGRALREEMSDLRETLFTEATSHALHERAVQNVDDILHNCKVFSRAASSALSSARAGDQIGTLLAGYWSLTHDGRVTPEAARALVADSLAFCELATESRATSSEHDCLEHLLNSSIRVDTGTRSMDYNIAHACDRCKGIEDPRLMISPEEVQVALINHGMRWIDGKLFVANSHPALARIFSTTQFGANWGPLLKRIPGATSPGAVRLFGNGPTRGTLLPV